LRPPSWMGRLTCDADVKARGAEFLGLQNSERRDPSGDDQGSGAGLGYRYWVEQTARARGLEGWVRNRRDGNVEALFAGPPISYLG